MSARLADDTGEPGHPAPVRHARTIVPSELTATLVLVRHGESTWIVRRRFQGRRNPWLTERGRAQAAALARRLADPLAPPALPVPPGPPVAIWHSPLKRAGDTARAIVGLLPVQLLADARLAEIGQGEWETRSHRSVAALGPGLAAWREDPMGNVAPGGEPLPAVRRRVRIALVEILSVFASSPPGGSAAQPWGVVVSHEGTLRVAMLLLLGLPLARFWAFPFEPCAITVIELADGQAILRAHNLRDHLGDLSDGGGTDRGGAL